MNLFRSLRSSAGEKKLYGSIRTERLPRKKLTVGSMMKPVLSGEFTVSDAKLYEFLRDLLEAEDIFLEPSACAAFMGAARLCTSPETLRYIEKNGLSDKMKEAAHIVWATGGSLVPEPVREEYRKTYL